MLNDSSIRVQLLLIGIFFLTMFIVIFLFVTNKDDATVVQPVQDEYSIDVSEQEITQVTSVETKSGGTMATRDFLLDDDVVTIEEDAQIYMIGSETGADGSLFEIFYFKGGGGGITVSLLNPNLQIVRARAEEELQRKLGVGLLELCALNVSVTVPRSVSPDLTGVDYSGVNLGLPSCPGAVTL